GYIFVFTGLIMNLDNEAELAGVLAHEMAHVTQRHVASRVERGKMLTIGSLLLAVAGIAAGGAGGAALAAGAMGAGQAAMLNYSRIDENEADHMGYQYLMAAGYPLQGMVTGFQKIRKKSWMSGSSMPAYLSTHPELGDRVNGIQARIQAAPTAIRQRTLDNKHFLRVKTLLWARYGDEETALQMFSAAKTHTCLASMGKGIILARQNKISEADAAFDKALACGPTDPLIMREAGIFHFRKGDMSKASPLLRAAIQKDSRDYMARFFYARMLDETGRSRDAHPYYEDVLRSLPEDQEVHTAYGRSLGESGKHFDAFLHLAYSALYGNDKKRTEKYYGQAKGLAKSPEDKRLLDRFTTRYTERKEIWKEGM
ncbi:MAG: M48 family metalloprotease, partial [Desulfovibrionaceae bacterium]